jgi:hypothetical protein
MNISKKTKTSKRGTRGVKTPAISADGQIRAAEAWPLAKSLQQFGYVGSDLDAVKAATPYMKDAVLEGALEFGRVWGLGRVFAKRELNGLLARRFCGVPDRMTSGLHFEAYGAPGGRWSRGKLTYRVNAANCNLSPTVVNQVIAGAFQSWQAACPFFAFTRVQFPADIEIQFGGSQLNDNFGAAGGVAAVGAYPESGRLNFDSFETWTQALLLSVSLHEIGHVLGLSHSNNRNSVMYPYDQNISVLDPETISAIRALYGWQPQQRIQGVGSSHGPSLAVAGSSNFTSQLFDLYMVWKGIAGDSGIYWSRLNGNSWLPQEKIQGVGTSHGPVMATYNTSSGGVPSYGLFLAWKGVSSDSGIYFTRSPNLAGWDPQQNVSGVGTSARPALAEFQGKMYMAWKGISGDQGLYYSSFDGNKWAPQQNIRGVGTSSGPALLAVGSRLYLFWKGVDGDSNIYFSWRDNTSIAIWQAQRIVAYTDSQASGNISINVGTSDGPGVALRGNAVMMAWKGVPGDSGIWFAPFENDEWSGQINVAGVGTSAGPALTTFNGRLYMAWKGIPGDSGLYFSWLG